MSYKLTLEQLESIGTIESIIPDQYDNNRWRITYVKNTEINNNILHFIPKKYYALWNGAQLEIYNIELTSSLESIIHLIPNAKILNFSLSEKYLRTYLLLLDNIPNKKEICLNSNYQYIYTEQNGYYFFTDFNYTLQKYGYKINRLSFDLVKIHLYKKVLSDPMTTIDQESNIHYYNGVEQIKVHKIEQTICDIELLHQVINTLYPN